MTIGKPEFWRGKHIGQNIPKNLVNPEKTVITAILKKDNNNNKLIIIIS